MIRDGKLYIAKSEKEIYLNPKMCNRHGLIAGATGTGKTVTVKVIAESLSAMGVPTFMADIKGDISGMCEPGTDSESMQKRLDKFEIRDIFQYRSYPTHFWDVYGDKGHPVRVSVKRMGPQLLARVLGLTDVQTGVLQILFKVAEDNEMKLVDLKDLQSMLIFIGENSKELTLKYGNVSTASVGAVQRALLTLESEGAEKFFGEPSIDIKDWFRTDFDGRGFMNILHAVELVKNPLLYSTFMLWMLTEIYETMPEVGDLDRPRMVFFFDEAHLLFNGAPAALTQKIEQTVKLIRSKGIGVFFISQSPGDIPDNVLAQLSNRIQHALRAYTPNEQKAVKTAANSFRDNPDLNEADAIYELGVGEALVSFLDDEGIPMIVERAKILPPESKMAECSNESRLNAINSSEFELKYRESVDDESAFEVLAAEREKGEAEKAEAEAKAAQEKAEKEAAKAKEKAEKEAAKEKNKKKSKAKKLGDKVANTALNTTTRYLTNKVINKVFGSIFKK